MGAPKWPDRRDARGDHGRSKPFSDENDPLIDKGAMTFAPLDGRRR
jgi:hypothetical protein